MERRRNSHTQAFADIGLEDGLAGTVQSLGLTADLLLGIMFASLLEVHSRLKRLL